jgi:alpha-D-xyloside xylohydrolase
VKFTEGFWLRSEQANALYASCAYELERIEGGMRILAPTARIDSRGATLNLPTITLEFRATGRNTVTIRSWHFAGYDTNLPRFETNEDKREVEVNETSSEFVMSFDDLTITVV